MDTSSQPSLLLRAWEENWPAKRWIKEVQSSFFHENGHHLPRVTGSLTDLLIKYAFNGTEPNQFFTTYLQEGIKMQILSTLSILESVNKISVWDKPRMLISAVELVKDAICLPSFNDLDQEVLTLPRMLAKTVLWLLSHMAEALKACYKATKTRDEENKVQEYLDTLPDTQELVCTLLDKEKFRDLVLIGKVDLEGEEDLLQLQLHLKELMNVQVDGFSDHPSAGHVQELFRDLFKIATRFLSMTSMIMSHERKAGHIPSYLLQYCLQFEVAYDLGKGSQVLGDLLDIILRSENIPLDQFYVDLMRCSCHGILHAVTQEELLRWVSFFLFKVSSIVDVFKKKYRQTVGDNAIYFSACKQFALFNTLLDDVDIKCRCRVLPLFLGQCKNIDVLDIAKADAVLNLRKSVTDIDESPPPADSFPVGVVLHTARLLSDILKVFNSPLETHRDVIRQHLSQLANVAELTKLVAVSSSTDQYASFIQSLVRLNELTKRPPDSKEDPSSAENRCEIFNLTFVFLFYITTVYGVKVLDEIDDGNAFFVSWRKSCTSGIGEKNFAQTSMDVLLDQVLSVTVPSAVSSKWDEHCLCAGEVIRELAQAVGCRLVSLEVFQKICEGFKSKRPALCISASVWLCTQYKSLNMPDKDKTTKILKLFKRAPSQQQSRTELVSKALERHALPYGVDQVHSVMDTGTGHNNTPTRLINFTKLLSNIGNKEYGLLFDMNAVEELQQHFRCLGPMAFSEIIIKAILDCGYVERAMTYGRIATVATLLDPDTVMVAVMRTLMTNVIKHKRSTKLLADPRGTIIARFLGQAFAFSLLGPSDKESIRPPKMPRLDLTGSSEFSSSSSRDRQVTPLVSFLQELTDELSPSEVSAIHVFLASLLENVAIATTHLGRMLILPDSLVEKLLTVLPTQLTREAILLICDLTSPIGRKHAALSLSKKMMTAM